METAQTTGATLMDALLKGENLKNDAALARALNMAPAVMSKIRHGNVDVSAGTILRVHETFGIPVAEIRQIMAGAA